MGLCSVVLQAADCLRELIDAGPAVGYGRKYNIGIADGKADKTVGGRAVERIS
jgi:hypothetical protein